MRSRCRLTTRKGEELVCPVFFFFFFFFSPPPPSSFTYSWFIPCSQLPRRNVFKRQRWRFPVYVHDITQARKEMIIEKMKRYEKIAENTQSALALHCNIRNVRATEIMTHVEKRQVYLQVIKWMRKKIMHLCEIWLEQNPVSVPWRSEA